MTNSIIKVYDNWTSKERYFLTTQMANLWIGELVKKLSEDYPEEPLRDFKGRFTKEKITIRQKGTPNKDDIFVFGEI